MKKAIRVTIGALVVAALAVAIIPTTRDEIHWHWASHKDDTVSYESYVKTWPAGRLATEGKARYDERAWSDAQTASTVQGFERYVQLHADGKHVTEANDTIKSLHWQDATAANTVQGFERYVQLHADGKHVAEANDTIESLHWQEATAANTVQGFERYVQRHADGKHVAEANDTIESLHWQEATAANTVQGFERYVQRHADGKHVAEANDTIESLHWQEATAANTIRAYRQYGTTHPEGQHLREAETKATGLRTDDAPFDAAMKAGTEASLKKFLEDFPEHQKQAEAQQAIKEITEGRDIVDLLREKKIEIETSGSGIQSVSVRVRKLVPYPITVRVPVGSYFVSSRQSAQNMVTTEESKTRITGDDWRHLSVSAACANRPRDIPGSGDTFSVQRSPHQEELARLMPILNKAGVGYATRQAAVWIVTDNANYSDLGTLVTRQVPAFGGIQPFGGFQPFGGGTRTICEADAARAMKICDEAGIDITRKRIWYDCQTVLNGLPDGDIKTWLQTIWSRWSSVRSLWLPDGDIKTWLQTKQ
jgi:hypothetical protein